MVPGPFTVRLWTELTTLFARVETAESNKKQSQAKHRTLKIEDRASNAFSHPRHCDVRRLMFDVRCSGLIVSPSPHTAAPARGGCRNRRCKSDCRLRWQCRPASR